MESTFSTSDGRDGSQSSLRAVKKPYGGSSLESSFWFTGGVDENFSLPDDSGINGSNKLGHSYFRESDKIIHFVLVYVDDEKNQPLRDTFHQILESAELELETEASVGIKNNLIFVKIHIPDNVVRKHADILDNKIIHRNTLHNTRKFIELPECMRPDGRTETLYVHPPTTIEGLVDGTTTHLLDIDRIRIIWNILQHANYVPGQNGIGKLISYGVYTAAFPLHEGRYDVVPRNVKPGPRRLLYTEWASFRRAFFKFQPLDLVKNYFGSEIGLYFTWLEYYTLWLIFPAIVGTVVFLVDVFYKEDLESIPLNDICNSRLMLCPSVCNNQEHCKFVPLNQSCEYAHLSYMFDNPCTVFFAMFMILWGTLFLGMWKGTQARCTWNWNLTAIKVVEENRAEFEIRATKIMKNKITKDKQFCIPLSERVLRYSLSISGVTLITVALCSVFYGTIVYRIHIISVMDRSTDKSIERYKKVIASVTQYCMLLIIRIIAGLIFGPIAKILTTVEVPRTQLEYDDSFALKMIFLQFINNYAVPMYTAFLRSNFFAYPGANNDILSLNDDLCDPSSCIADLTIQISFCMGVRQILVTTFRHVKKILVKKYRKHKVGVSNLDQLPRWEIDYSLLEYKATNLFTDRLEMILQFGFVMLFGSVFPLAPLFALLYNIVHIRIHAHTLLVSRRIIPRKVPDLGIWETMLYGFLYFSVASSAFLIAVTSDFIPRIIYKMENNWNLKNYITGYYLAIFDTDDFGIGPLPFKYCRYVGFRLPPSSPNKYQRSLEYWKVVIIKALFIAIYEHVAVILIGIVAYTIPDIPYSVKQRMTLDREETLKAREEMYAKKEEKTTKKD